MVTTPDQQGEEQWHKPVSLFKKCVHGNDPAWCWKCWPKKP